MGDQEHQLEDLATPTLMRAARGAYARSIRAQLQSIGMDDLPRNGAFILAGIASQGGPRRELASELGVTKQAVSQAIDTLVNRGYLVRSPHPDDRRRITLELTDLGHKVVDAVVRGVETVDRQLQEHASLDQIDAMRSVLIKLAEIKTTSVATGSGRKRTARQLLRFNPIFIVRDLRAALAHYTSLGFDAFAYEEGDDYGFANRERTGLHLAADPEHDPSSNRASAYLYVRDADALYAEWTRPSVGGHTHSVELMPYGLREGSHVDPDGNMIRFGSEIDE